MNNITINVDQSMDDVRIEVEMSGGPYGDFLNTTFTISSQEARAFATKLLEVADKIVKYEPGN